MENAVEAAKAAFKTWSKTSILTRQQVMFRYQHIIRNNMVLNLAHSPVIIVTLGHACRKSWPKALPLSKAKLWLMLKEMFSEAFVRYLNIYILSVKLTAFSDSRGCRTLLQHH